MKKLLHVYHGNIEYPHSVILPNLICEMVLHALNVVAFKLSVKLNIFKD